MPNIDDEHVIEGVMFLQDLSREAAIEWLKRPTSPGEERSLLPLFSLVVDPTSPKFTSQFRQFVLNHRSWDGALARIRSQIRNSMIITAKDLAIRVGPC